MYSPARMLSAMMASVVLAQPPEAKQPAPVTKTFCASQHRLLMLTIVALAHHPAPAGHADCSRSTMAALSDTLLLLAALAAALVLRPWRGLAGGPPWPWLAAWAVIPWLWSLDLGTAPVWLPAMSGASLLMLLAGWPLAVLGLCADAAVLALSSQLGFADLLHRLVWQGLLPATLALGVGAAVRRWLPHHLMVYILGRAFLGTLLVCMTMALLRLPSYGTAPLDTTALAVGALLTGFGEAWITGAVVAALVVFRPRLLATYADRLYLPR
jgi:uncharacterized membrane protein